MFIHSSNNAPYDVTPAEIRKILAQKDSEGWEQLHCQPRAALVQRVVRHFGNFEADVKSASKALIECNGEEARPAYFCHFQARTNWARLHMVTKIERIENKLKENLLPKTQSFDKNRGFLVDFILYARIYEWIKPEIQAPRDRLKVFNELLMSVGFQPLYLFRSDDFLVQLAVLQNWSYGEYLKHLHSPLKEAMDEARPTEAENRNIFTGQAEEYLYSITEVGNENDPPFGKDDREITAWQFVHTYKNEFGRKRVSSYYALYQLLGHRDGIMDALEKNTTIRTAEVTKRFMTQDHAAYMMGEKNVLLNLAKARLTPYRLLARECYEQVKKEYIKTSPQTPVPSPLDLALWEKGRQELREFVLERWLSYVQHKNDKKTFSVYYDTFEERVILDLNENEKAEINQAFLNYIDVYSSGAQPTTENKKAAARAYDKNHEALPEGEAIDRNVFLHNTDVSKNDILTMLVFHMNAKQLVDMLPPPSPFGYEDEVETANDVVETIDELLNALDMPALNADSSRLDFLLLTALYNGVDYNNLSRSNPASLPVKDYVLHKILSPSEAEAEA